MTKNTPEPTKTLRWAKWIAKRPGAFFGVGLTVHITFVIVSLALYMTDYPILPIVFDDVPLELNDELMYRRAMAWYNCDDGLDKLEDHYNQTLDQRKKRDIHSDPIRDSKSYQIYVPLGKEKWEYDKMHNKILQATAIPGFPSEDSQTWAQFELQKPIWSMSTEHCCLPNLSLKPFSQKYCDCNPNLPGHGPIRSKRDLLDPDHEPHERQYLLTSISLIYEANDDNIFTKENLQEIAHFEYSLYERKDFQTQYCRLTEVLGMLHCQNLYSPLRFFDGTFSYAHDDFFDPSFTDVGKIMSLAYDNEDTEELVKYFIAKDSVVDTSNNTVRSKMTRSILYFGYPLNGYTDDDNEEEQNDVWDKWAYDILIPLLLDKYDNGLKDMSFYFYGGSLYWQEVMNQVFIDWYLLIGGFVFIFLFMWFQTGSLFITFFGVFSIFTSFVGANLIYCVIIGYQFFGIFNVLAIFIILGIGADDIFIYTDTWKYYTRGDLESLDERLSHTFKRAAKAMFVTSLTTMVAFFVSSFSSLLSVSAFGSFAGLTVLVNYISVILYLPGVVTVYHQYFQKKKCCCCGEKVLFPKSKHQNIESGDSKTNHNIQIQDRTQTDENSCSSEIFSRHKSMSLPDRVNKAVCAFFGGPFFRFVTNRVTRWIILVIYVVLLTVAGYLISIIQPAKEGVKLFAESHYFEKARNHDKQSFMLNEDEGPLTITVAWGLKPHDFSMCPKLKYDSLAPCDGETVWDFDFSLNQPESQMALLDFCQDLRFLPQPEKDRISMAYDEKTLEGNITCFIELMAEFYKKEGLMPIYPTGTSLELPITIPKAQTIMKFNPEIYSNTSYENIQRPFEIALNYWLTNRYTNETVPFKVQNMQPFLGQIEISDINLATVEEEDSRFSILGEEKMEIFETKLVYVGMEIVTTHPSVTYNIDEGIVVMNTWEDFISAKIQKLPKPLSGGFQFAWLFSWIKVLSHLSSQSIYTCVVGIALAFVVIFLGTTNIITGLWASLLLGSVTVCVIAVIPLAGWTFGLLEALNLCLVVGLAVDYIVHFAEGYHMSQHSDRMARIQETLEKVGISVLSGAITTLGASFFMLFAKILFFQQFGAFVFCTIVFSMIFSLFVFMAAYSIFGPQEYFGSFLKCCKGRNKYEAQDNDTSLANTDSYGAVNPAFKPQTTDASGAVNPVFEPETTDASEAVNPVFEPETTDASRAVNEGSQSEMTNL